MAKDLIVVRHAKSDWSYQVSDIDRPLNERGFEDAPRMGEQLRNRLKQTPDLFVSSPAKRAITTAQIFAKQFEYPAKRILIRPNIYEASHSTLLKEITLLDDTATSVILFGHNPGLSDLVSYLSSNGDLLNLPTCAVVQLHFEVDSWQEISGEMGKLISLAYPSDSRY
jgi:phosphohistidine phosphatase